MTAYQLWDDIAYLQATGWIIQDLGANCFETIWNGEFDYLTGREISQIAERRRAAVNPTESEG
jgi:hypothetical protein